MSDLTDDELELALTVGDRLEAMNRRAYVDREALAIARRLQRAAIEVRRHRAMVERLEVWAAHLERTELEHNDVGSWAIAAGFASPWPSVSTP